MPEGGSFEGEEDGGQQTGGSPERAAAPSPRHKRDAEGKQQDGQAAEEDEPVVLRIFLIDGPVGCGCPFPTTCSPLTSTGRADPSITSPIWPPSSKSSPAGFPVLSPFPSLLPLTRAGFKKTKTKDKAQARRRVRRGRHKSLRNDQCKQKKGRPNKGGPLAFTTYSLRSRRCTSIPTEYCAGCLPVR